MLFIVGPTAIGKSALAVALAKKLDGEILSADSMLVYQGMDIGTAKPTPKERGGIPHHGIDLIPPTKSFSVFAYRQYALKAVRGIVKRGKIPIVAGGTGFYIRALLEGLSPLPGTNAQIRGKLEREAQEKGLPALYRRLLKIDPSRARAIGPHNQRRIIRALEIYLTSGKKPSRADRKTPGLRQLGYRPIVIGIHRDREALYGKINRRVDAMFRKGLVREVKRLGRKKLSQTSLQGVGYKEILEWLRDCHCEKRSDAWLSPNLISEASAVLASFRKRTEGKYEAILKTRSPRRLKEAPRDDKSLTEVKDRIKQATRHFAKRQWTWFKREQGIRWVWWPEGANLQSVRDLVLKKIKRP